MYIDTRIDTYKFDTELNCVLINTSISGDRLRWDSITSLTDASNKSDFKNVDKKSLSLAGTASRSRKGASKRSSASSSSSPLRKGGGEGGGARRGRDAKLKSEKKSSLGRRKGGGGMKGHSSGTVVTLADLAQSVPRATAAAAATPTSNKGSGMESPSIGNGNVGLGDQVMWKGSMELELCDATTPSSGSRKSIYSQEEEESSLSERESVYSYHDKFTCIIVNDTCNSNNYHDTDIRYYRVKFMPLVWNRKFLVV